MLQSNRLKDHIQNIGIDPSLSNNTIHEHKCLEKIKKWYKQASKCDNQQQFKVILEAAMVSTPEGFTKNIPISTRTSTPVKKTRAWKSLCMFTNVLEVKKTAYCRVGAVKSKHKVIKLEIHHGNWNKSEKGIQGSTNG